MFCLNSFGKLGAIVRSAFADPDAVIKALFASGEQGAWYDPSDLTTMFQDRAGTTPVTADGQTVGKILDKSGNDNHAVAPNDSARPLYKTSGGLHWLQFDGVDDNFVIATPGISILGNLSIFYGAIRSTNSPGRILTQSQSPGAYNDYECGWNPNGAPVIGQVWYQSTATSGTEFAGPAVHSWGSSTKLVFSAIRNSNSVQFRFNGENDGSASGTLPQPVSGGTKTLQIGRRGDGYGAVNGNIYSIILLGRLATTQEITDTETWVASKTGVTL